MDVSRHELSERRLDHERYRARKTVEKKIPRLIKKVERRVLKGKSPVAQIIVPYELVLINGTVVVEVVNELLAAAGAKDLRYLMLDYPTSNPYVPIPSGIFTRLYVGIPPVSTR